MPPDAILLAHHPLLLAVPAFVPAIAITLVVLVIAKRDRIAEARELAAQEADTDDHIAPPVQEDDR
ncbi:hypothetical protein [Mumia sp. ZJ430]|uniref:hypothetical protein n=1 Tax=Mumia sp. ZJ430 TaxID=2708083 RepID=UPI0014233D0C|nr:hypothetical protein [Mumia sp. ZJ430]